MVPAGPQPPGDLHILATSLVLILDQVLFFRLSGAGPGTLGTVYEHEWLSREQVAYYLHNSSG